MIHLLVPLIAHSSPRSQALRSFLHRQLRTMTPTKNTSDLSDIGKLRTEPDGSFKRPPSSFRNFIKNDGQFLPEKGQLTMSLSCYNMLRYVQGDTTSMYLMRVVSDML